MFLPRLLPLKIPENYRKRALLATDRLLDLVFPRSCASCLEPVDSDSLYRFLCAPCSRLITIVRQPTCTTCGFPFFGTVEGARSCPHCEELSPLFSEARTATLMKGPARELVHGMKYQQQLHLLEDMLRIVREAPGFLEFVEGALLIPVPLHSRKLRERGFNQSHLLAQRIARISRAAGVVDALDRVHDTVSQTQLDRKERFGNLKNAFALRKNCLLDSSLRYVLVDDVFTTGSTLNACAAVLRRAEIHRLDVLTFGHG